MPIHNVEITNVYKNRDIEYRVLKQRYNKRIYSMIIMIVVPILVLGCIAIYSESSLKDIYHNVCNLYNPIYSPYAETGSITFAGAFDYENDYDDIEMPILSSDIRIDNDGTIIAKVKESILIKSVLDGVVESITESDGVKVVRIIYSDSIAVDYINLDVAGVNVGNIVKKGKEIGTAKLGSEVSFKVYYNNHQIDGIKIENNKLVWQS